MTNNFESFRLMDMKKTSQLYSKTKIKTSWPLNSEHKQEDDGMTLPNEKTRQETTVSTNKKMTG